MKDPVDQAIQRAQRYWQVDGLTELGFGMILLLLGTYFYLDVITPDGTFLRTFLDSGFVLILVGISLLTGKLINFLKQRITYPRTGYLAYRKKSGSARWFGMVFAALISIGVSILIIRSPGSLDWMPGLSGFILGLIMAWIAWRGASLRFWALAVLSAGAGLGLSMIRLGNFIGVAYFYLIMAAALFVSGGITLVKYLGSTRPVEEG